jgi:hypothetical protein
MEFRLFPHSFTARAAASTLMLLTGCATERPFSDKSIIAAHQAYIRCAVQKAFAAPLSELPVIDVARSAVAQCEEEKAQVQARLREENAGKPGVTSFVAGYIDEMHLATIGQIAAELPRLRAIRRAMEKGDEGKPPKGSRRI